MMRQRWFGLAVLGAALTLVAAWGLVSVADTSIPGASPVETQKLYSVSSKLYLALDDAGGVGTSPESSQFASSTYWQVQPYGRSRGYRSHLLIQRGNNAQNAKFLAIDGTTGKLILVDDRESDLAKWLVRYAGRHRGYNTYYLQNLGESEGKFDMQFVVADQTGGVRLDSKPVAGAHFRMTPAPSLPAELIHSGR